MLRMTDAAVAAIPDATLRDIVVVDRELDAIRASATPDFARFKRLARDVRPALRAMAVPRWGHTLRHAGPGGRAA